MNIFKLSIAKLTAKPFNTFLSLLLFAVGVTIISLIFRFEKRFEQNFRQNIAGVDLVVGAKGSPLQLILSSVFQADVPTGNISLEEANKIKSNPMVKSTIPMALGDNYKGYRIVGTEQSYPDLYECKLKEGKWFSKSMDVVIGAEVAEKTGLKVGDLFTGVHGFTQSGHHHDEFKYTVVGIMEPNENVTNRLVLTPVESVWLVHSHHHHHEGVEEEDEDHHHEEAEAEEHHHDEHAHEEEHVHSALLDSALYKVEHQQDLSKEELRAYNDYKGILQEADSDPSSEITALLVFARSPIAIASLPRIINENTNMQAASPALELNRLMGFLGYGIETFKILAWIIIVISGLNILIHLTNTLNQSIYEVALLRALGASRIKVMFLLLSQGTILSLGGWLAGIIISRIIWLILPQISAISFTGIQGISGKELLLLLYCFIVGALASLFPAIKAYKTDIHFILSKI
ncbi:FtsX-like permease family protein [Maribellus comscasis]|uniref:FtsX-like permease family protein n=1 Tax=Maribellus comscasis TaxID=2681766 RepID=A0A6I6JNG6_9BACT|nr:ABC transporter permease [Maribellus comscasis]QGY43981.1 FtsX-like permease family protein [Maribellus comscasis]